MAYPMLESPLGNLYFFDGQMIDSNSKIALDLFNPTDEVTYYETIRIMDGVLLYVEDHLARLVRSVNGIEKFEVDTDSILKSSYEFLKNCNYDVSSGNLRIVLTKSHLLIHICEANIPSEEVSGNGINTSILNWERVDPNIKVFRGDYKKAVADTFKKEGKYGLPYEVLLTDNDNKLYEGSKSNLFAIVDNKVYSAPDDKILIGITRNRVLNSLNEAGGELVIGTFSLEEIKAFDNAALFVSSTPFDILPIKYVDDYEINSASNPLLQKIASSYKNATANYISEAKIKYGL